MKLLYSILIILFFSFNLIALNSTSQFSVALGNHYDSGSLSPSTFSGCNQYSIDNPYYTPNVPPLVDGDASFVSSNFIFETNANGDITSCKYNLTTYHVLKDVVVPCEDPTDKDILGVYSSFTQCNEALLSISAVSSSSSLACGCSSASGSTKLYASQDLTCNDGNQLTLNTSTGYSTCTASPQDNNSSCTKSALDIDGDCIPNESDPDIDGDGIPNESDNDANGDGTLDINKTTDDTCKGANFTISPVKTGKSYDDLTYRDIGESYKDDCTAYATLNTDTWDGSLYYPDINPKCFYVWCRVHTVKTDCKYNALDFKPTSDYVYIANLSKSQCNAKVDNIRYDDSKYVYPSISKCSNTAFCYLRSLVFSPDDINNSLSETPDTNSTDTNTLNAQKDTNKHLKNLNDKTDDINKNLEDLKQVNSDLLTNNKDMKSTLDELKLNSDRSLKNQLDSITNLAGIKTNTANSVSKLGDIKKTLDLTNQNLHSINKNQMETTKALNDGLFTDINPFSDVDFTDDGSSTFSSLGTTASDSFGLTYETGLFNLSSITTNIPTIGFSLLGNHFTMIDQSMFNGLPINDIRNTIMFIFALMGFITVIKTV